MKVWCAPPAGAGPRVSPEGRGVTKASLERCVLVRGAGGLEGPSMPGKELGVGVVGIGSPGRHQSLENAGDRLTRWWEWLGPQDTIPEGAGRLRSVLLWRPQFCHL